MNSIFDSIQINQGLPLVKNTSFLDLQTIFDTVSNHLLTQNQTAMIGGSCRYRGDNGLKCAVGCLISDSDYCLEIEGVIIKDTDVSFGKTLKNILLRNQIDMEKLEVVSLLIDLQKIHDAVEPWNWKVRLKSVAENHRLNFKESQPIKNKL